MQLIAWFGVCLLASFVLRRHAFGLSLVAIIIWCGIPGVAGHYVTGSSTPLSDVHPAAVLVLTTLGVQLLTGAGPLQGTLARVSGWLAALLTVAAAALVMGLAATGLTSLSPVVNQLVAPVSLFYLLGSSFLMQPRNASRLRLTLLIIAFLESTLSIVQNLLGRPLLWATDYQSQYWFNDDYHRWMGTFDHPLILSLFLTCSIFLLAELRHWWLTLVLLLLFIGGLLVTQSRIGFLAAAFGCLFLLARARLGNLGKLAFLVLGVVTSISAYRAGVGAPLQDRVTDDSGSSAARQFALNYFGQHWNDYLWSGRGLDSSFKVAAQAGLQTSFESAFMMYTIDIGLVFTLLYFSTMIGVIGTGLRHGAVRGGAPAAAVAFIIIQTFSGMSSVTAVPAILWTMLALAGFTATTVRESGDAGGLQDLTPLVQPGLART